LGDRIMRFERGLLVGLCFAATAAVGGAVPVSEAAVFGSDDRGALPARHKGLSRSIGLFFNVKAKTVCSAFCVGDSMIATASHCIFKTAGEKPLDPVDFRFGPPNASPAEFARVAGSNNGTAAQSIRAGTTRLSTKPPIDAASDWALVRLDRPVCRGAVLPVEPAPAPQVVARAAAGQIFHVAFHRDRLPWKLTYAGHCRMAPAFDKVDRSQIERDFRQPDRLLLHRCGTAGASSGSPLLAEGPDGPVVVGINVGTYVQSRIVSQEGSVLFRSKPEAVANTAVNASAFADQIATFSASAGTQDPVKRSNRAASSADSGTRAAASGARLLRQSSQPAKAKAKPGIDQSRTVDGANGGLSRTKDP
jgi:Trypsin-like peptidase domain